jgi:hypothetical protein
MTVDVETVPRSIQNTEIEFIDNLDVLSESAMCSCSAGDDNPF